MSCPTVIRVTTAQGPPGVGLPAGGSDAGKFVRKAGSTPYAYELVTPDAIGLPQDLALTSAPTFAGLTLSGLAANGLLFTGTGGALTRLPLGSGLAIVGGALTATGDGGSGSVTSVGLSAPAGFSVTGSPVTGSGTLGLVFATGYSLPTDARQAQWDGAVALAGTAVQPGALATGLAGKADLDGAGKVPAAQLPGFVDDVVEFANVAAFPVTGEAGKLYISLATNRQYRWSGSIYAEISPSPGSTDAVPEGSVNLYFTSTRGQTAAAAWWAGSAPAAKLAGIADNATANLGTVTSIGLVAPTGFSTTGAITTSGNITLSFSTGYSLPTDARQADWDAAFTQRRTWDGGSQHLNAATGRASLELGTAAQAATTDFATAAQGGLAATAMQPGLVASSGLTMTTERLLGRSTAGTGAPQEITLGTGLSFSGTTLNAVGGSPGGTSGQLQWNNGGAFVGVSTTSVDGAGNLTFTGRWIQSTNGAASAPPMSLTGTWFTGGTATTTKPQLLIEPAGTTSNNWSTSGTGLGINAASGFAGNLLDLQVNGTSQARISSTGGAFVNTITTAGASGGIESSLITLGNSNSLSINIGRRNSPSAFLSYSQFGFSATALTFDASTVVSWTNMSLNAAAPVDLSIVRDAANTLAQRNGTAAQTFRIYNTFTNVNNYERLAHTWVSNVCYTRPENAGTGSARLYVPVTGATTVAGLPDAATAGAGARSFVTDANSTTFLATVAGGGANKVPVVSDGTNWLIA